MDAIVNLFRLDRQKGNVAFDIGKKLQRAWIFQETMRNETNYECFRLLMIVDKKERENPGCLLAALPIELLIMIYRYVHIPYGDVPWTPMYKKSDLSSLILRPYMELWKRDPNPGERPCCNDHIPDMPPIYIRSDLPPIEFEYSGSACHYVEYLPKKIRSFLEKYPWEIVYIARQPCAFCRAVRTDFSFMFM